MQLACEYKNHRGDIFREQGTYAEIKVTERVRKATLDRENRLLMATSGAVIPRGPTIGPDVYAVNKFFTDLAFDSKTLPYLRVLPVFFSPSTRTPCLLEAIPAVALASTARQLRRSDLMSESHRRYGNSLKSLARALADRDSAVSDDTLLTVFLLGLYEILQPTCIRSTEDQDSAWSVHGRGRLALLRLRGREQLKTKAGRNLFTLIYHQQLASCILDHGEPLPEYPSWLESCCQTSPSCNLVQRWHDVVSLCSQFQKYLSNYSPLQNGRLQDLLDRGQELDKNLDSHFRTVCGSYRGLVKMQDPVFDRIADVPSWSGLDHEPALYAELTWRMVDNLYRGIRIYLLNCMLKGLPLLAAPALDYQALGSEWTNTINTLAMEINNDIPFILGECDSSGKKRANYISGTAFRAYMMILPLRAAVKSAALSDENRQMLEEQLRYVVDMRGLGLAFEFSKVRESA